MFVLTKPSLPLFYYQTFGVVSCFCWALWVSGNLIISYYIACIITSVAGRLPVAKFWKAKFWNLDRTCIDEAAFFRWNCVANMILDAAVLYLPYVMARRLQATMRQKDILAGMFLLGNL